MFCTIILTRATKAQLVYKMLSDFMPEFSKSITAQDVAREKKRLRGQIVLSQISNQQLLSRMQHVVTLALPLNYYSKLIERIGRVSKQSTVVHMHRLLTGGRFADVLVGPAKKTTVNALPK